MESTKQQTHRPAASTPSSRTSQLISSLHKKRSAVAHMEDADATLTGMTRSLDRRLLALNLQPEFRLMKVA